MTNAQDVKFDVTKATTMSDLTDNGWEPVGQCFTYNNGFYFAKEDQRTIFIVEKNETINPAVRFQAWDNSKFVKGKRRFEESKQASSINMVNRLSNILAGVSVDKIEASSGIITIHLANGQYLHITGIELRCRVGYVQEEEFIL